MAILVYSRIASPLLLISADQNFMLISVLLEGRAGQISIFAAIYVYQYTYINSIRIFIRIFAVYLQYIFSICSISAYMGAPDWQKRFY
jgi:hypothetical protein